MEVPRELSWRSLVEALRKPVAVTDADGNVLSASPDFRRLVDGTRAAVALQSLLLRQPLGPDAAAPADTLHLVLPSIAGMDLTAQLQLRRSPDGRLAWCLLQVEDPDVAGRDALTGLLTREALILRLRQALGHQVRHGGHVEVVVLDLDRFKEVNDRHGHVIGDEVLIEVARRLVGISRPEDTAARWGGDEFVLLLTDVDDTAGEVVCARIDATLSEPMRTSRGPVLTVSGSCGSVRAEAGDDPITLMHAADVQMYERKRQRQTARADRSELSARLAKAQARAQQLHAALREKQPPVPG